MLLLSPIADKRSNEPWNWFVGSSIPGAFFRPFLKTVAAEIVSFYSLYPHVMSSSSSSSFSVVVVVDVVIISHSINAIVIVVFITTTRINLFYFSVATKLLENKQQVLCRPPWDGPF